MERGVFCGQGKKPERSSYLENVLKNRRECSTFGYNLIKKVQILKGVLLILTCYLSNICMYFRSIYTSILQWGGKVKRNCN